MGQAAICYEGSLNILSQNNSREIMRREEAHRAVASLQHYGIQVIYIQGHHRKLAIIDRQILYEGSLNILSQNNSREIMRRIESRELAWQMARFVDIDRVLG